MDLFRPIADQDMGIEQMRHLCLRQSYMRLD
jgi:hypothetical protein